MLYRTRVTMRRHLVEIDIARLAWGRTVSELVLLYNSSLWSISKSSYHEEFIQRRRLEEASLVDDHAPSINGDVGTHDSIYSRAVRQIDQNFRMQCQPTRIKMQKSEGTIKTRCLGVFFTCLQLYSNFLRMRIVLLEKPSVLWPNCHYLWTLHLLS